MSCSLLVGANLEPARWTGADPACSAAGLVL